MARILLALTLSLGAGIGSAFADVTLDLDALLRHYDANDVAKGRLELTRAGDVVYVRGTSKGTPWLDVWQRNDRTWTLVAEMVVTEISPIRFGAKRTRGCRTS